MEKLSHEKVSSHVRAVLHSLKAVLQKTIVMPPVIPHGGSFGLPADFLITDHGYVVACKYGVHANDQRMVDEVLDLAVQRNFSHVIEA